MSSSFFFILSIALVWHRVSKNRYINWQFVPKRIFMLIAFDTLLFKRNITCTHLLRANLMYWISHLSMIKIYYMSCLAFTSTDVHMSLIVWLLWFVPKQKNKSETKSSFSIEFVLNILVSRVVNGVKRVNTIRI